jgi:hypothetical protein
MWGKSILKLPHFSPQGLEIWKEKNEDKTKDEILADIFTAMIKTSKHKLATQLREQFADNSED